MISENLVTLDTLDRHDVTRRHLGILGSFRVCLLLVEVVLFARFCESWGFHFELIGAIGATLAGFFVKIRDLFKLLSPNQFLAQLI